MGLIGIDGRPTIRDQVEQVRLLVNIPVHDDNCKQRHGNDQERVPRSILCPCSRVS